MPPAALLASMSNALIDTCLRGSRVREDLLIAAHDLVHTSLTLLAERAGVTAHVARMAIEGREPWYSRGHSLVACGLVEPLGAGRLVEVRVTLAGRGEARRALAMRRQAALAELARQRSSPGQRRARRGRLGRRL